MNNEDYYIGLVIASLVILFFYYLIYTELFTQFGEIIFEYRKLKGIGQYYYWTEKKSAGTVNDSKVIILSMPGSGSTFPYLIYNPVPVLVSMKFHDNGEFYSAFVNPPESFEYRAPSYYTNALLKLNNISLDWDNLAYRGFDIGIHVK